MAAANQLAPRFGPLAGPLPPADVAHLWSSVEVVFHHEEGNIEDERVSVFHHLDFHQPVLQFKESVSHDSGIPMNELVLYSQEGDIMGDNIIVSDYQNIPLSVIYASGVDPDLQENLPPLFPPPPAWESGSEITDDDDDYMDPI